MLKEWLMSGHSCPDNGNCSLDFLLPWVIGAFVLYLIVSAFVEWIDHE